MVNYHGCWNLIKRDPGIPDAVLSQIENSFGTACRATVLIIEQQTDANMRGHPEAFNTLNDKVQNEKLYLNNFEKPKVYILRK